MLGFSYIKAPPTSYLFHYRNGKLARSGAGISFWYFRFNSVISKINVNSIDVPFVFSEVTADVQEATIQGDLTFRVVDPSKTVQLLDFTIDNRGRYTSDDPEKLNERLVKAAQIGARAFVHQHTLPSLLVRSDEMVAQMQEQLRGATALADLGVELLGLSVLSIKATPEMTKALQAKAREQLLLEADEAIHHRRNTAVQLERQIKENELQTEIAVEAKRRQVRETRIEADIAIETQRAALVDQRVDNERKEAIAKGEALAALLEPIKQVDWKTLVAVSGGGADSSNLIAMAFRDLAENAQKIGTLNISPDLLDRLLTPAQNADSASDADHTRDGRSRGR